MTGWYLFWENDKVQVLMLNLMNFMILLGMK